MFREDIEPLVPQRHFEKIKYWFVEENIVELGKILRLIYEETDEFVRDWFLVAFSHILKSTSLWLQRSTKPTRDLKKKNVRPSVELQRHIKKMQEGNNLFFKVVPEEVRQNLSKYLNIAVSDARKQPVSNNGVDMVITSSPYVTSYEYADLHQLSTIWLDFTEDLTAYKKQFIGTSYKRYEDRILRSKIAESIVRTMKKNVKRQQKK